MLCKALNIQKFTCIVMCASPGFASTGISLHPIPSNLHCLEFGPDGFVAIAAENIVSIYKYHDGKMSLFRVLPHHRALITAVKWSSPSVEIMRSGSFHQFVAVADDRGNCIVYDVLSGVRHAGISPDKDASFAILGIEWGQKQTLFVLTTLPSLVCVGCSHRRSSNVESLSGSGLPFAAFNMKPIFSVSLPCQFSFIKVDPFSPSVLVLLSTDGKVMIAKTDKQNEKAVMSSVFPLPCQQEVLNMQFYPHTPNYLIVIHEKTIVLFNLATKEQNVIFVSDIDRLVSMDGVFMADSPGRYWVVLRDGTMIRYVLDKDGWLRESLTAVTAVQLRMAACDPYCTGRIATIDKNGNLTLFQERNSKVFAVAHVPWFPEVLTAWTCATDRLFFATNLGYIGVLDRSGQYLRFSLEKDVLSIAYSESTQQIVAGGNEQIHYINLARREITTKKVNFAAQKISASGDIVVLNPLPNVLNVVGTDVHRRFVFDSPIKKFTCDRADKLKWAVLFEKGGGVILDLASKTKRKFTFKENDDFLSDVAYSNDHIYVVTTRGELYILTSETKECKTIKIGETSLKAVDVYNYLALIIDDASRAVLFDTTTKGLVGFCRSKVIQAKFVSESIAVVQTSDTSIKYVSLPSFEPMAAEKTHQKRVLLSKFAQCETFAQFESVGQEVGDLEFLQVCATLNQANNMMLPASYVLPHDSYLQKEKCTRSIDRLDEKHIIELDIITGNMKSAAAMLLKHADSRSSLLWAHCCLAPNLGAAHELAKVAGKHYKIVAQLLIAAGDPEAAVRLLIDNDDWAYAIRFTKLLFTDEISAPILRQWIRERPRVQRPDLIFALLRDHHAFLALLAKSKTISRAIAYLTYLEENNITIEPSEFQEMMGLSSVDDVVTNIHDLWNQFKSQVSILP